MASWSGCRDLRVQTFDVPPGFPPSRLSNFLSFPSNFLSPPRLSTGRRSGAAAWVFGEEGGGVVSGMDTATWKTCPIAMAASNVPASVPERCAARLLRVTKRTVFCFVPFFATTANFSTATMRERRGRWDGQPARRVD